MTPRLKLLRKLARDQVAERPLGPEFISLSLFELAFLS